MEQFITDDIISIHAPRTGSDDELDVLVSVHHVFQSTLPARGATRLWQVAQEIHTSISIHAPRTGSDDRL